MTSSVQNSRSSRNAQVYEEYSQLSHGFDGGEHGIPSDSYEHDSFQNLKGSYSRTEGRCTRSLEQHSSRMDEQRRTNHMHNQHEYQAGH